MTDFADESISVFGKPDMLSVTGDKSGDGSGFLGAQVYFRLSCGLRPASVVTDILPRRAVNTSTLQFANGFLFLVAGVSLNCVTRVF